MKCWTEFLHQVQPRLKASVGITVCVGLHLSLFVALLGALLPETTRILERRFVNCNRLWVLWLFGLSR